MDEVKIEYDISTINSDDADDTSSVICLSDAHSEAEDETLLDDCDEIFSIDSETLKEEESVDDENQSQTHQEQEEITVSRCRSCGSCVSKELVDQGTQTEDQPTDKNPKIISTQPNNNRSQEEASASTSNNSVDKQTGPNSTSSATSNANETKSLADKRKPTWRNIQPYRNSNSRRVRPYNNYNRDRRFHNSNDHQYFSNNNAMNHSHNVPRPYYVNPGENWPASIENYYKSRIYTGFVNFANYVFQENGPENFQMYNNEN